MAARRPSARQTAPVRQARIGVLAAVPPTSAMLTAFREGMRQRGYIEGQNLFIDVRWPQGTFEQHPSVAADLVSANVEVIVAWSTSAVIAARRATSAIPIVMVSVGDPIGSGFVTSLARPGGNITGLSNIAQDLSAKIVGLLVELVPGMKRVGIVSNAYNPNVAEQLRETEDAVGKMGFLSHVVEAEAPEEYDRAFAQLSAERVDCVVVLANVPGYRTRAKGRRACAGSPPPDHLSAPRERRGGRADVIWKRRKKSVSSGIVLCRPPIERRQSCRSPGGATDQIRSGDQSKDCGRARPRRATVADDTRR